MPEHFLPKFLPSLLSQQGNLTVGQTQNEASLDWLSSYRTAGKMKVKIMDATNLNLVVDKLQRYCAATILAMCCLVSSSCLSYRLNYFAQIEVESDIEDKRKTVKRPQNTNSSPASVPIAKNIYSYRYGANYSTGILPYGCAATFWLYGGFCLIYLGTPFADDLIDIEERATKNLQTLLAGRDYFIRDVDYEKVEQTRDQPYFFLSDRDGSILAKGNAPAKSPIADMFKPAMAAFV